MSVIAFYNCVMISMFVFDEDEETEEFKEKGFINAMMSDVVNLIDIFVQMKLSNTWFI